VSAYEDSGNPFVSPQHTFSGPVRRWVRALAWLCVLTIAVLSLLPGEERPHTGLAGRLEHAIAYAGTGFFFWFGYSDPRHRALFWIGLAIASGVFEVLQNFVPGRSPSIFDALASTLGLTFGCMAAALAQWSLPRRE
jgi:VanZ family protein